MKIGVLSYDNTDIDRKEDLLDKKKYGYIYAIINKINNKVYVGKTVFSVEERWREHTRDYGKRKNEKRPLYAAMRKYGIENFTITELEKVDISLNPNKLSEREEYWIEHFNSYHYGYNATTGGDGKPRIDYLAVMQEWKNGLTCKEIADKLGHDRGSVSTILDKWGVSKEDRANRAKAAHSKAVAKIDPVSHKVLAIYPSTREATIAATGKDCGSHIAAVCKGTRSSAYKSVWCYMDDLDPSVYAHL